MNTRSKGPDNWPSETRSPGPSITLIRLSSPGRRDVAARRQGVVRIDLERDDGAARRQAGRHGHGRVAGEGADFEHPGGLGGKDQGLEEPSLLASHHHPPRSAEILPG